MRDEFPTIKQYTVNIDLTELNNTDIDRENDLSNQNMYNIRELFVEIDSLSKEYSKDIQTFANNTYYRAGVSKFNNKKIKAKKLPDSLNSYLDLFSEKRQTEIAKMALNNAKSTVTYDEGSAERIAQKVEQLGADGKNPLPAVAQADRQCRLGPGHLASALPR